MSPNSVWNRLLPRGGEPHPDALQQLSDSQAQYNDTVSRGVTVARMSAWFDARRERNHFGDDLAITHVRRNTRHA